MIGKAIAKLRQVGHGPAKTEDNPPDKLSLSVEIKTTRRPRLRPIGEVTTAVQKEAVLKEIH